jgi:hypothetical protein
MPTFHKQKIVTVPFFIFQCQYAPKLTETGLKKLVKEEMRDKMIFMDVDGTETDV